MGLSERKLPWSVMLEENMGGPDVSIGHQGNGVTSGEYRGQSYEEGKREYIPYTVPNRATKLTI